MGRLAGWVQARIPEGMRGTFRVVGRTAGWQLARRTVRDGLDDRVHGLSAEVAFFALLSLPALLLMLLGSLGFIAGLLGPDGAAELHRIVYDVPRSFLTERTYASYEGVATRVLREGRAEVVSLGAVVSLWAASRVVVVLVNTVTIAYDLPDPRPIWHKRLLALSLTLGGLLVGALVLPALVLGPQLAGVLAPGLRPAAAGLVDVLFVPALSLVVLVVLAWFYHLAAPWATPWHRDLPGAVLAMAIWLLAALGLRVYIAFSIRSEELFAQLATPLAVALWLYVTAFAVLLGAELNAEIEKMWPHRNHPWRRRLRRSGSDTPEAGEVPDGDQ